MTRRGQTLQTPDPQVHTECSFILRCFAAPRSLSAWTRAQANVFDFFGILATLFEWTALWYMCHDKAGCISPGVTSLLRGGFSHFG